MTSEKDYAAAAEWAENEMTLPKNSRSALRGKDAAEFGRAVIERAQGGRPALDSAAAPGQHARVRQVRLPRSLDAQLTALADAQHRRASEIMRDALSEYVSARGLPPPL